MKRIGEPVLACDAPQEVSPAQIEPWMLMFLSAGMLIVVPALMINFAPPATNKSPSIFMTPVQVSVPVIVPDDVSFTAIADGAVETIVTNRETKNKLTKPKLLLFWTFTDMIHPRHVVQILDRLNTLG